MSWLCLPHPPLAQIFLLHLSFSCFLLLFLFPSTFSKSFYLPFFLLTSFLSLLSSSPSPFSAHSSHYHLPLPLPNSSSHLPLPNTGSHQIFMLLEQGPIAQTRALLSAVLLRCVCVYYLYIHWLSVSAGIANMFLNISGEIVWNSPVADDDSLTALSDPQYFHSDSHTSTHTARTCQARRPHIKRCSLKHTHENHSNTQTHTYWKSQLPRKPHTYSSLKKGNTLQFDVPSK